MSDAPTTAPSDGDWTRSLTTIAVVARKPRPEPESVPESELAAAPEPVAEAEPPEASAVPVVPEAPAAAEDSEDADHGPAADAEPAAEVPLVLPRRRGDDSAGTGIPGTGAGDAEAPSVPAADDASDARLKSLVAAWVASSDTDSDAESDTETAEGTSAEASGETSDEASDGPALEASYDAPAESPVEAPVVEPAVEPAVESPSDVLEKDVDESAAPADVAGVLAEVAPEADGEVAPEGSGGPEGGPAATDPDTALLSPVEPAGGPDTALLTPVGQSGAKGADLDSWVASLGARPKELADKPAAASTEAPAEAADADDAAKETVPARRRFINPWLGGAAVVALLLAGAAAVDNPFTMATAERVPVSDVARMSDPEPDQDSGPVNGGVPLNLELPPLLPAAAPGASVLPSQSPSGPAPSGQPFTLPPLQTQTPASTVTGSNGIPQLVLSAYRQAAEYTAKADPKCRLPWELLAAVGRVESGHANGGQVSTTGTALTPILGPRLDGTRSTMAIRDTDKGALDFDTEFDRAVGPMQFIPTSWKAYAMDGNKDGKKDPQNVYDATLTASRYLCAGDRDLSTEAGLDKAIFSYNRSPEYVRSVKAWTVFYKQGVRPVAVTPPPPAPATSSKPPAPSASTSPSSSKSTSKAPATTTKAAPKTSGAPSR
ncbi:lytic murein transglycosylase [Streptomycetaceae bacterium NBC_01309]